MKNNLHRPVAKTAVLIANSPLPPKAKKEIGSLNIPPFFKWLLNQLQDGIYPRIEKEMEITGLASQTHNLTTIMLSGALNDTIPEKIDSVITFFENQSGYGALYNLIPVYIKLRRFNDATIALEQLIAETNGMPVVEEKAQDYKALKTIEMQIMNNPNNITKIIEGNYAFLKSLAETDYGYENSMARALLELGGYTYYKEKYPLPSMQKSAAINLPKFSENYSGTQESLINVYPNPAGNKVNIEYISLKESGSIMFYDIKGKLFKTVPVTGKLGFEIVDISDLPNGIYIISNNEFGNTNSVKITVQH